MIIHLQQCLEDFVSIWSFCFLLVLYSSHLLFTVGRRISTISHHVEMSEDNRTYKISGCVDLHSLALKIGALRFKVGCFISTSFENLEFVKEIFPIKGKLILENILIKILKHFLEVHIQFVSMLLIKR